MQHGERERLDPERRISRTRAVIFSIFFTLLSFFLIEAGVRLYYYVTTSNSYYLFFGFVVDESKHNNQKAGYFKFLPGKNLHQGTSSHSIPTRINSQGFRGQDFSIIKGDRRRVVTMGGSSTFGYYSRDLFTYPAILQSILNQSAKTAERYEVINVGIPHMQSLNIVKMLEAEVLSFDPDLITLYTGCNDTWTLYRLYEAQNAQEAGRIISLINRLKTKLVRNSLAFHKANDWYINSSISAFTFKHREADDGLNKTVTYLYTSHKIGKRDYEKFSTEVRDQYASNLRQIAQLSSDNHIRLLFIKQKYSLSKLRSAGLEEPLPYASAKGYFEEVDMAAQRMQQQQWLWLEEASLLTHAMLMEALQRVAEENRIRVVDGIAALDADPVYLKSYVHLSEAGNAVLAEAIARNIPALFADTQSY